ncbi:DgyrCDS5600 [Dimorphilus gyrociliatus]|uniref:DgyrCDS5600 n=1 Tax=Dimorphilus gyrociliatus TaxID=2664684 RepID=A0A7I8VL10_9ANNE|nr:DgyrCDS5600 [Dimorphilus gyrociliatus]
MFLADTHILGNREGHWFDKLRREWQMERSFQTAMAIHSPEVVFILGDLFDEGKWSNDVEFKTYVNRFNKMFRHSSSTKLYTTVGNHDIGFHYMVNPHNRKRFESAFDAPSMRMIRLKKTIFVLANSMAFEGDGCDMCAESEKLLNEIGRKLDCAQNGNKYLDCHDITESFQYSRPILLQHFPMFRKSDWNCSGVDAAPVEERHKSFRPKYDCLSKEASNQLFNILKPRLVVSGHTHHGCLTYHLDGTPEYTVASFNWRNKANSPSFLLVS